MKVPTIDSKLAKSLMVHDLDNLVYEKRQRKTVQPIITPPPIQKPKVQKPKHFQKPKQFSKNKQEQNIQKNIAKTIGNKLGRPKKIITKERIINYKKNQISQNTAKISKYQVQKSMIQKSQQKKIANKDQKLIVEKQTKNKFSKKNDIDLSDEEQVKEEIAQIKQIKKKGRPRKIHQPSVQNAENVQKDQIIEDLKKNQDTNKKEFQIQKLEEQYGSTRTRKAKINSIKRYTQNQIFQNFQQQNQKYYPEYKVTKKKKNYTKRQSYYNINRIFRKEPKIQLKSIQIMANLQIASLNFFAQKFGQFDLVHSSLPISILLGMNQIPNLIKKGFMLIWVERGQTTIGYHLMNRWGFDVIDQIIWIKCDQQTRSMIYQPSDTNTEQVITNQNMFLNCKSSCLVGYKCPNGQKAEYRTKISNNIIFAKPKLDPIRKPDEIFEICDLLVPGSKKLQLGGPPQNGWLSLNHQQNKFFRCWSCLRDLQKVQQLRIISSQDVPFGVFCRQCETLLNQENISAQKNLVQRKEKIIIKSINYIKEEQQCNECQKYKTQLIVCKTCQNNGLCQQCLEKQYKKHANHQMSVIYKKIQKFNQTKLNCSECFKSTLVDFYYECQNYICKTKNHLMCQQCFWKNSQQIQELDAMRNSNKMIQQKDERQKKSSKRQSNIHEWKIKKIVCYPQLKNQCFSCKIQQKLPYYCCQNCLGWTWCGACKVVNNEIHSHSQKHNLFLMI